MDSIPIRIVLIISTILNQSIINPDAKSPKIIDREMQINFIAEVNADLEWQFKTLEKTISIKIGENYIVEYEGKNLSNRTITSTAIFTASPELISPYLVKIECFCFVEQTLKPGESKIFAMTFALLAAGPWILQVIIIFTKSLFNSIPTMTQ